ncbi:MAG: GNAT family N-acetyltransferase [Anaerovoracaceae bacterium]|jgi:GNAT superfamily N-acetyltransferase
MVREVRAEQLERVRALILSGLGEIAEGEKYCKELDEHLKNDALWYYLLDDREVAVLGVENKNHISLCFTDPDYRGRGAAKELFEAVKTILLARGFFEITADAVSESEGFFKKLGFQRVGQPEGDRITMLYRF